MRWRHGCYESRLSEIERSWWLKPRTFHYGCDGFYNSRYVATNLHEMWEIIARMTKIKTVVVKNSAFRRCRLLCRGRRPWQTRAEKMDNGTLVKKHGDWRGKWKRAICTIAPNLNAQSNSCGHTQNLKKHTSNVLQHAQPHIVRHDSTSIPSGNV